LARDIATPCGRAGRFALVPADESAFAQAVKNPLMATRVLQKL
jgi:hypothetical protein